MKDRYKKEVNNGGKKFLGFNIFFAIGIKFYNIFSRSCFLNLESNLGSSEGYGGPVKSRSNYIKK